MPELETPTLISPEIPLCSMDREDLEELNQTLQLALQEGDLVRIRDYFQSQQRNPTRVELEVLAQTWSEHCKHRVFNAEIHHRRDDETEIVDGIFATFVERVTRRIMDEKPGFVLSAFTDNAGFIRLDDTHAACLKVETHNHPSAIDPYAGANTGIGGVIRDVLGAGKGARPVASLDVFCLGDPELNESDLPPGVIHPQTMLKGVARGVRDYGNRMGIPTVAGAIMFHDRYTCNPLVFCGTAGILPREQIEKSVRAGMTLLVAGGRTGRDGLRGATFSSAELTHESHQEDRQSVQIGNPIEEKKLADFVEAARNRGLIQSITDCGAGGLSSAVGEMVQTTGGRVHLERVPLKEEDMEPWEIFLSESQERMVIAARPEDEGELETLANRYATRCTPIGRVTDTGRLDVRIEGTRVCELDQPFLHNPPRLTLESRYRPPRTAPTRGKSYPDPDELLPQLLGSPDLCSREPIIRQYDFEVQGNTVGKPLSGPGGDNPRDGAVIRAGEGGGGIAIGVSALPRYGELNPRRMGMATVDEALRQVTVAGANPERVGILDNFCLGNPEDPEELGRLVESARGMAEAALKAGTPFISGKDSFYNFFQRPDGTTVSIPTTLLISALGVLEQIEHCLPGVIQNTDNHLILLGETRAELGGSAVHEHLGRTGGVVPAGRPATAKDRYRRFHRCVREGLVESAHDCAEGGWLMAAAEMGFSGRAGIECRLEDVPTDRPMDPVENLYSESCGRILFEVQSKHLPRVREILDGETFAAVGETTSSHRDLVLFRDDEAWIQRDLEGLKQTWKHGLTPFC